MHRTASLLQAGGKAAAEGAATATDILGASGEKPDFPSFASSPPCLCIFCRREWSRKLRCGSDGPVLTPRSVPWLLLWDAGALPLQSLSLQPAPTFLLSHFCSRNTCSTFARAFLAFVPVSIISDTLEDVMLSCRRGQAVSLVTDASYQNVFFKGWRRWRKDLFPGKMTGLLNLHISGSLSWQETKQAVALCSFNVCRVREAFPPLKSLAARLCWRGLPHHLTAMWDNAIRVKIKLLKIMLKAISTPITWETAEFII